MQTSVIGINVTLEKQPAPVVYEKMDLSKIPVVTSVDTSILVRNLKVNDVSDANIADADVLYYTVQVMALHHPVDVSYFRNINDMKVMYNDADKFYRYTTGKLATRDEAAARRGRTDKERLSGGNLHKESFQIDRSFRIYEIPGYQPQGC